MALSYGCIGSGNDRSLGMEHEARIKVEWE